MRRVYTFVTWTEIVYYKISSCVFLSPILILSLAARLIFRSLIAFKAAQPTSSIHTHTKVPITAFWSSTGSERREAHERHLHCMHHPAAAACDSHRHTHICAHPLRAKTIIIMEATVDSFISSVSTAASRALCLALRARATGGRAGTSFLKRFPPSRVFGRRFRSSSTLGQCGTNSAMLILSYPPGK